MIPSKISRFNGPYAYLSNFHPSEVTLYAIRCPTVEHAFQMAKAWPDREKMRWIAEAPSPASAKRIGQRVALRPDWEETKDAVMLVLLREKFSDPHLRAALVGTGDAELVEGNDWGDTYWGADSRTGAGTNRLGGLLMRVREDLRGEV